MAIVRAKRKTNFTIIGNTGLKDKRLTLKAKGLLAYMLSLPDDWIFYETELMEHSKDGRDAIRSALKELEGAGYLVRHQKREDSGKFGQKEWKVWDEPLTENPTSVNQISGNPTADNPTLLNTNPLSTNELSTDKTLNRDSHDNIPYKKIIDYLNQKAGTNYRASSSATKRLINGRFHDGFKFNDFKCVIDNKVNDWKGTTMEKYIRPQTLFGTKFEGYLNQKNKLASAPIYPDLF
jgi:uncharacterized phage protein (TIGR02220 family)